MMCDVPIWRCRRCRARQAHPIPDGSALAERYEEEHAAGKWTALFEGDQSAEELERRMAVCGVPNAATGRLIDVGAGDGRFMDVARSHGWRCVGLEISPSAAAVIGDRHAVAVGGLEAIRSGSVDLVTFWDVLEHVPDPDLLVEEAARVLRPGGVIATSMPNLTGVTPWLSGRDWAYYDFGRFGHIHHLGRRHVEDIFRRAGLVIRHSETLGSTDFRDLPFARARVRERPWFGTILDRVSGVVARAAVPTGRGNTLLVVGQLEDEA